MVSFKQVVFAFKQATVLRGSDQVFRQVVDRERWTREKVDAHQAELAIAQARFAMQNTSFYREYYASAGFTIEDLEDPAAFHELPIVEKHHVRENFDGFKTSEATKENTVLSVTGGSTGQPLHLLRDKRVSAQPLEWRLFRWWGVHPSDHVGLVWRQVKTGRDQTVHAVKWWPSKRIQLDAYSINDNAVRAFTDSWNALRPSLLTGYAGGILELSRSLQRQGLLMTAPVAVATTASPLSEQNKAEVAGVLGAPVYDHYRSAEIPWMGGECAERAGHHVFADMRVIEVVGDDGVPVKGQLGRVVASDLTNRVFPLIRYRLGDRTRTLEGACPCGVNLPRIDHLVGKEGDGLRLPDGSWIATEAIFQLFSLQPAAVRQYQVHQRRDHSVAISVVRGDAPDSDEFIEATVASLRARLGHQVAVTWQVVTQIPHDGGKVRYVKSDVEQLPIANN